jgi:glycosyltransferase involved in cell wall biosynthesis
VNPPDRHSRVQVSDPDSHLQNLRARPSPNVPSEGVRTNWADRPLCIAITVGQLPLKEGGGTERQAFRAAIELAKRGHGVWLFARGPCASQYCADGVWVLQRPGLPISPATRTPPPLLRFASDLTQGIADMIRTGQRFDVVLSYHTFNAGIFGTVASLATRTPQVLWIRSGEEYRCDRSIKGRVLAPAVWLRANKLLLQSPGLAAEFANAVCTRVPPKMATRINRKIHILSNGLDLPADAGAPSGARELLFVGRLHPGKGLRFLIQALPMIPEARLTVVGEGEERASLEALARGLPVTFVGSKSFSEMSELYRRTSVAVFPSMLDEGLPNVVLEAFAFGRPVVATRKGGVVDLVENGVNGALVDATEPTALATAINSVLQSQETLVRMGAAARRVAEAYTWDALLPRLETVLAESRKPRRSESQL